MASSDNPLLKNPYWKGQFKTSSYTITGQDIQTAYCNTNSTANIVLTLPKAVPGLYYKFVVTAAHQITVTPKSTDTIRGKALGASAVNSTVGSLLSLICVTAGFWEPEINNGSW